MCALTYWMQVFGRPTVQGVEIAKRGRLRREFCRTLELHQAMTPGGRGASRSTSLPIHLPSCEPLRFRASALPLRALILVILTTVTASSAHAQTDTTQLVGCSGYSLFGFDIGIRARFSFPLGIYTVRVFDVASG